MLLEMKKEKIMGEHYIEYLNIKTGLKEDEGLSITRTETRPAFIKALNAWDTYTGQKQKRMTARALEVLEVYDAARKYRALQTSFWLRLKNLFRA